jgi:urate oxidase
MASIAAARYGKDNVRVYKVERDEKTGVQTVTEMTVCVLLEGAIDVSYDSPPLSPLLETQLRSK